MIIRSLNTMEKIINKNNNLLWRGWDVIDLKESDTAKTSPMGIRVKDNSLHAPSFFVEIFYTTLEYVFLLD